MSYSELESRAVGAETQNVTAYINSGGRGSRLNSVFVPDPQYGIAKGLLEVGNPGIKLIDHHINHLSESGLRNIVVGAGDLRAVSRHIQSSYNDRPDVSVVESSSYAQLGTAGDLLIALRENPQLFGEQILINNVDTILALSSRDFILFHLARKAALSIALTTRNGVPNEGAFLLDSHGVVLHSAESNKNIRSRNEALTQATDQGSSTGALLLETAFLQEIEWTPEQGQVSLYRDIMGQALAQNAVAGFNNGKKFFVDIGTEVTWRQYARSSQLQEYLRYGTMEDNTLTEEGVA